MGAEHAGREPKETPDAAETSPTAAPAQPIAPRLRPGNPGTGPLVNVAELLGKHALPVDLNSQAGWFEVVATAADHLAITALWPALRGLIPPASLDPDLAQYLEAVHGLNVVRNRRVLAQAREAAAALNAVAIEPVFLKGLAILLLNLAPDLGARLVGDIDLLVTGDRFDAAAQALRAIGYRDLAPPNPDVHDRGKLMRPDRPAMIELHQFPVPINLEHLIPTRELLDGAQLLASAAPARARAPRPEHLVLHNVIHAMLHHRGFALAEVSLRDALDLALLFRSFGPDLDRSAAMQRLAAHPETAAATEFYFGVCNVLLPDAGLPAPTPGPAALSALRRWGRRGGSAAPRRARVLLRLREFVQDVSWRLRHVPEQRRRFLAILLTPRRYGERLGHLVDALRYGVIPHPRRRHVGAEPPQAGGR